MDFQKASYSVARGDKGTFLELNQLMSILPVDYLVTVKNGKETLWRGVVWVYKYERCANRYNRYAVLDFAINYNNTEVLISTAWRP